MHYQQPYKEWITFKKTKQKKNNVNLQIFKMRQSQECIFINGVKWIGCEQATRKDNSVIIIIIGYYNRDCLSFTLLSMKTNTGTPETEKQFFQKPEAKTQLWITLVMITHRIAVLVDYVSHEWACKIFLLQFVLSKSVQYSSFMQWWKFC